MAKSSSKEINPTLVICFKKLFEFSQKIQKIRKLLSLFLFKKPRAIMAPAPSLTPEHVTILPERILRYIFSFI